MSTRQLGLFEAAGAPQEGEPGGPAEETVESTREARLIRACLLRDLEFGKNKPGITRLLALRPQTIAALRTELPEGDEEPWCLYLEPIWSERLWSFDSQEHWIGPRLVEGPLTRRVRTR